MRDVCTINMDQAVLVQNFLSASSPVIKQLRFKKIGKKGFSTVFSYLIPLFDEKKSLPKFDLGNYLEIGQIQDGRR